MTRRLNSRDVVTIKLYNVSPTHFFTKVFFCWIWVQKRFIIILFLQLTVEIGAPYLLTKKKKLLLNEKCKQESNGEYHYFSVGWMYTRSNRETSQRVFGRFFYQNRKINNESEEEKKSYFVKCDNITSFNARNGRARI